MQETVTNTNERKSLFSSYLEILEAQEKQAELDRQLQEEKYLRRTQRIYEFHERQRESSTELRRCLNFVSQHAAALETALRTAAADGPAGHSAVPLGAALARPAAALRARVAHCLANAAAIRAHLAAHQRPHMDNVLAKMEAELGRWTTFVQRCVDATCNTEVVVDNLQNMIAEQRRCVREVEASNVFLSLCGADAAAEAEASAEAGAGAVADGARSPPERRAPSAHCSTPIARD